ncbi:hypothetical protein QAD02_005422 [Eretmocerus hayati]|uniref:Uncharacterized protein n=1 Tax=Eretmocerus hayati TaxID=131215 RepID=A0ACC2NX96_9HYME|nr:hypothetical protein QAD02_005422 [Eretmocerus hayati]
MFWSPGPNFTWHIDGYDKLRLYGFLIHGAIDGFLAVFPLDKIATTNKNPKVVSHYYLTSLKDTRCVPTVIRADPKLGKLWLKFCNNNPELSMMMNMQDPKVISQEAVSIMRILNCGVTSPSFDGFLYTIIESIRDKLLFNGGAYEIKLLQFCFTTAIQVDLVVSKDLWNRHCMKEQPGNSRDNISHVLYN